MEIKFRGKSKRTGEWVYGQYFKMIGENEMTWTEWIDNKETRVKKMQQYDMHFILTYDLPDRSGWDLRGCIRDEQVIKESVGQLLHDIEMEYWEGDVFEGVFGNQKDDKNTYTVRGKVVNNLWGSYIDFNVKRAYLGSILHDTFKWSERPSLAADTFYFQITGIKKIGNFHDNPELLTL